MSAPARLSGNLEEGVYPFGTYAPPVHPPASRQDAYAVLRELSAMDDMQIPPYPWILQALQELRVINHTKKQYSLQIRPAFVWDMLILPAIKAAGVWSASDVLEFVEDSSRSDDDYADIWNGPSAYEAVQLSFAEAPTKAMFSGHPGPEPGSPCLVGDYDGPDNDSLGLGLLGCDDWELGKSGC